MTTKTKKFVEDLIISIVLISIVATLYYLISQFVLDNDSMMEEEKAAQVVEKKIETKPVPILIKSKDINQTTKIEKTLNDTSALDNTELCYSHSNCV